MDTQKENKKFIENIPWAMDMRKRLELIFDNNFIKFVKTVVDLSDNMEDIKKWTDEFEEHFEETCTEMVSDIERLQSKFIKQIIQSFENINDLCNILQIKRPQFGQEQKSLYQEHIDLLKHIHKYEQQIMLRRNKIDELKKREMELCKCLGKNIKTLNETPLPSAQEVDKFQNCLDKLEAERFSRVQKYCSSKEDIVCIIEVLQYRPESVREREFIESHNFEVTDENMQWLSEYQQHLQKKLDVKVKEDIPYLWNKIESLWNILDIPLLDREHFKKANKELSLSTMKNLKQELSRCDLKKKNNQTSTEKLRAKLDTLWSMCHCYIEDAKNKFTYYDCEHYNQDLLCLFESEVEKWSTYYESNKELIMLLEKHKKVWTKMMDLEEKSEDPSRLSNRGGQLLKEGKERNALSKKIPVLEKRLLELAEQFSKQNGVPFQTFGYTIEEYIQNLHDDQENIKKEKTSARKIKLQSSITPVKSVARLYQTPSVSTLITPKRKLVTSPHEQEKRSKLTSKTPLTEPHSVNKRFVIPKITVTAATAKRRSVEWKERVQKMRRKSAQKKQIQQNQQVNSNSISEYGDFQMEPIACSSVCETIEEVPEECFTRKE